MDKVACVPLVLALAVVAVTCAARVCACAWVVLFVSLLLCAYEREGSGMVWCGVHFGGGGQEEVR